MRSLAAFVRSDLYRAWRTHYLWGIPAFLVAIVVLSTVLLALVAYGPIAEAVPPDDPLVLRRAIEGSPLPSRRASPSTRASCPSPRAMRRWASSRGTGRPRP